MDAIEVLRQLVPMVPCHEHEHFDENMKLLEEYARSTKAYDLLVDVEQARAAAKGSKFDERAPEIWIGLIESVARIAKQNDPEMNVNVTQEIADRVYHLTRYMRRKPPTR